jgi:hypothetical protein
MRLNFGDGDVDAVTASGLERPRRGTYRSDKSDHPKLL